MVVISMVPYFSVMTLTILLERLQLLQTASIRETRSCTWFFSLAARCHCDPALSYVSLSTFLDIINPEYCKRIDAAFKPTDFTQRRTNQSSLFQSTPRRPASSVWETFPLHKFMGSSARENQCGTMWCKIG